MFDFKIQINTGRNPKEKAGFLVAKHKKARHKLLVSKNEKKVCSFFPSDFFSGVVSGSINKSFFSKEGSILCVSDF